MGVVFACLQLSIFSLYYAKKRAEIACVIIIIIIYVTTALAMPFLCIAKGVWIRVSLTCMVRNLQISAEGASLFLATVLIQADNNYPWNFLSQYTHAHNIPLP